MTEYMFILGSNWLLSIAELLVYVRNRGYEAVLVDHSRNAAIVDFKEKLSVEEVIDMQSALGGCYKTGRVIQRYDIDIPLMAYPTSGHSSKESLNVIKSCPWFVDLWQNPRGKKIKFGVSTYPVIDGRSPIQYRRFTRGLNDTIKQMLIQKGAKRADYYAYDKPDKRNPKKVNLSLWPKTLAQGNLLTPPNNELLAAFTEKYLYLARTMVVYDSMLQQYRDESRPYISSEISTSPKVCRTLLNLAGARPGDTVLDPFCGTGTLLIEAALLGMKCIGVDINAEQVQGTKSNLLWFAKDSGQKIEFQVIRGDSQQLSELIKKQVDAVAFEPSLGPVVSKQSEIENAEGTIKELTHLYHDTLIQIEEILRPDGRVAMTIPVIISSTGSLSIDVKQMVKGTGLGIYRLLPSDMIRSRSDTDQRLKITPEREQLPERKRGQIVQRAVIALEK